MYFPKKFGSKFDINQCLGIRGTDKFRLNCTRSLDNNRMITFNDLFESKDVKPDQVEILLQGLMNPKVNRKIPSWEIETFTQDGYPIDSL